MLLKLLLSVSDINIKKNKNTTAKKRNLACFVFRNTHITTNIIKISTVIKISVCKKLKIPKASPLEPPMIPKDPVFKSSIMLSTERQKDRKVNIRTANKLISIGFSVCRHFVILFIYPSPCFIKPPTSYSSVKSDSDFSTMRIKSLNTP